MFSTLTSAVLTIALLPAGFGVTGKPSLRETRSIGEKNRGAYRGNYVPPKDEWQTYVNDLIGVSVEHPDDWQSGGLWGPEKDRINGTDFRRETLRGIDADHSYMSVALNRKSTPWTLSQMQREFEIYTTQPETKWQRDHYAFIHEYRLIESGTGSWKGRQTLVHTFEGETMSLRWRCRQVRIGEKNTMYLLSMCALPPMFEKDSAIFDRFVASLTIRPPRAAAVQKTRVRSIPSKALRSRR